MIMHQAILVSLAVFAFLDIASSQECNDGWSYHDGSCYGFGQEAVTWSNAEFLCKLYEATLAEVDTKAENDFLKAMAMNNTLQARAVWIGATDIFNEGHWVWINSKQPVGPFTDWFPGEPNQSGFPGGEDCLQYYGNERWQWNDEDCDQNAYFICEMRMVV